MVSSLLLFQPARTWGIIQASFPQRKYVYISNLSVKRAQKQDTLNWPSGHRNPRLYHFYTKRNIRSMKPMMGLLFLFGTCISFSSAVPTQGKNLNSRLWSGDDKCSKNPKPDCAHDNDPVAANPGHAVCFCGDFSNVCSWECIGGFPDRNFPPFPLLRSQDLTPRPGLVKH